MQPPSPAHPPTSPRLEPPGDWKVQLFWGVIVTMSVIACCASYKRFRNRLLPEGRRTARQVRNASRSTRDAAGRHTRERQVVGSRSSRTEGDGGDGDGGDGDGGDGNGDMVEAAEGVPISCGLYTGHGLGSAGSGFPWCEPPVLQNLGVHASPDNGIANNTTPTVAATATVEACTTEACATEARAAEARSPALDGTPTEARTRAEEALAPSSFGEARAGTAAAAAQGERAGSTRARRLRFEGVGWRARLGPTLAQWREEVTERARDEGWRFAELLAMLSPDGYIWPPPQAYRQPSQPQPSHPQSSHPPRSHPTSPQPHASPTATTRHSSAHSPSHPYGHSHAHQQPSSPPHSPLHVHTQGSPPHPHMGGHHHHPSALATSMAAATELLELASPPLPPPAPLPPAHLAGSAARRPHPLDVGRRHMHAHPEAHEGMCGHGMMPALPTAEGVPVQGIPVHPPIHIHPPSPLHATEPHPHSPPSAYHTAAVQALVAEALGIPINHATHATLAARGAGGGGAGGGGAGGGGDASSSGARTGAEAGVAEWRRVMNLLSKDAANGTSERAGYGRAEEAAAAAAAARMAAFAHSLSPPRPQPEQHMHMMQQQLEQQLGVEQRTFGERLRARMVALARAKEHYEAQRLLEILWRSDEHALLGPRLLLWAAQRRTTAARLWWGQEERETSARMLTRALESGRLDEPCTRTAGALLEVVQATCRLHTAHHPAAREMGALQHNVTSWMQAGVGTENVGWERPAATSTTIPAHVRKMVKRYDALRASLLRAARESTLVASGGAAVNGGGGGLPSVPEVEGETEVEVDIEASIDVEIDADAEAKAAAAAEADAEPEPETAEGGGEADGLLELVPSAFNEGGDDAPPSDDEAPEARAPGATSDVVC